MLSQLHLLSLLIVFTSFQAISALHASEVGVVDWHKSFIGVPRFHSQNAAPSFHRFRSGKKSTRSIVLSATSSNVLGAIDAISGDIAWRYVFDVSDPIVSYSASNDTVVTLSGPGGAVFRTFDSSTGDILVEDRLHEPLEGHLSEPVDLGSRLIFARSVDGTPEKDVYTLTNGRTLHRLDALTGQAKWKWSSEEDLNIAYSRITQTSSTVFLLGLVKGPSAFSLHVTAISATGEYLASVDIPSSISNGIDDFLALSDETEEDPVLVWLENGQIRFASLSPSLVGQPKALKGATFKSLIDISLTNHGHFLALRSDGAGMALKADRNSKGISLVWEFEDSATADRYSESIYSGGLDKDNKPYIGRVFWSHVLKTASAHVYAPHAANGKGMVRGYTFPFDSAKHGIIKHAALDGASPSEHVIIGRFVLTTSTGAVQLWQHDRMQWSREEALAEVELAEFIELPEQKVVSTSNGEESFFDRVSRQLTDAKDFPSYLVAFAKRFATGSYVTASSPAAVADGALVRDAFGFRKLLVVATRHGVIYGIDSSTGSVVWSRVLGLGWAASVGARHIPLKVYLTSTISDGDVPKVVLITQRLADNGLVDTVLFHIEALTGQDAEGKSEVHSPLEGIDIVNGEILDSFLLKGNQKIVMLIDKYLQVYLFPDTDETQSSLQALTPKLHFPLLAAGRVLGHQVQPEPSFTGKYTAFSTWTTVLPRDESIVQIFRRPASEPVASLGKVLGDRSTLYKYLNPNLVGYITSIRGSNNMATACGLYIVDGAKGAIIYHSVLPSAAGKCDLKAEFTENWLVYTYYDGDISSSGQAKGHRLISVEMYEGKGTNDKTRSSESSVYHNRSAEVTIFEQSYILPYAVSAMSITSTKYGIATKDLIVANSKGQIQSFSRRLLDPRRPKSKVTPEQQEERLIQYDPVLPDDPRRVISHTYNVINVHGVITSPALLESTSLIFAYGLDLFSTRVAPSHTFDVLSENFNKMQLVMTIVALSAAIMITKPMVRRKRLREQWYQ